MMLNGNALGLHRLRCLLEEAVQGSGFTLTSLHLRSCGLGFGGAFQLADFLQGTTAASALAAIQTLDLSSNKVRAEGVWLLTTALPLRPALETLLL